MCLREGEGRHPNSRSRPPLPSFPLPSPPPPPPSSAQAPPGGCEPVATPPALENILPAGGGSGPAAVDGGPAATATECGDGWQPLCALGGAVWRRAEGTLTLTVRAGLAAGAAYEFALALANGAAARPPAALTVAVRGSVDGRPAAVALAEGDAAPGCVGDGCGIVGVAARVRCGGKGPGKGRAGLGVGEEGREA